MALRPCPRHGDVAPCADFNGRCDPSEPHCGRCGRSLFMADLDAAEDELEASE